MRLIDIFLKDLKSFFRDIKSFILLFLTPIVLVLIIGMSFLSVSPSNIHIAVCSMGNDEIDNYIKASVQSNNIFVVDKVNRESIFECRQYINDRIVYSSYRAGLIVPEKSEYQTTELELIVDNSKLVSEFIKSYFRILTDDLSRRITKGYVDILFTNIDEVKANLDEIESRLNIEKNRLTTIRQSLNNLRNNLNYVRNNINSARNNIQNAENSLDASITSINSVNSNIVQSISQIDSSISAISSSSATNEEKTIITSGMLMTKTMLQTTSSSLTQITADLRNIKSTLSTARTQADYTNLDQSIFSIDFMISSVDSSISDIDFVLSRFSLLKNLVQKTDVKKPETIQFVDAKIQNFFGSNNFIDFMFHSSVMMVIMIISIFLASITFIRQRSSGLLQRLYVVPDGIRLIVFGRILLVAFLSIISLPIIILVGIYALNVTLTSASIILIFVTSILTSIIFASIGLVIASVSKYESTAILLSIFITLPMIFLSGIITPLEKLPEYVAVFASGLPLNASIKLFESITFYSPNILNIGVYFLSLFAYIVSFTIVAWIFIKRGVKG